MLPGAEERVKHVIVHSTSLKQRAPVIAECIDFSLQIIKRCMEKRREAVKAHEATNMASQEALIKPLLAYSHY